MNAEKTLYHFLILLMIKCDFPSRKRNNGQDNAPVNVHVNLLGEKDVHHFHS